MKHVCPLIEISGAPHERGRQYGVAARRQIERGVAHYSEQLSQGGFDRARIHGLARAYLPRMEAYDGDQVTEMRGIAAGSELALEDIVLLNARTEIVKLGTNPALRERLGSLAQSDECTSAMALPGATATGTVIQGQNWDWKVDCAETTVVLKIRRDDGPDVLTFTEAGGLARSGFNSAGIAITSNYLDSDRDYADLGVPLLMTRRKMLECAHLPEITRIVYSTRRSGSNNLMISHAGGVGFDLECAPDEVFLIEPEDGIITHANHWDAPDARCKLRDTGIANTPDTILRQLRARQIMAQAHGRIDRETFRRLFLDTYQHPYSICRPPRESVTMRASATIASIIIEAARGEMEIAVLPALDPTFTVYRLEMDQTVTRAAALA